jgi:hypothetical protein
MGIRKVREITATILMAAATRMKVVITSVNVISVKTTKAKMGTWSAVLEKTPAEAENCQNYRT